VGVFAFDPVPPGEYVITIDAAGYTGRRTARVTVPDPHACIEQGFFLSR